MKAEEAIASGDDRRASDPVARTSGNDVLVAGNRERAEEAADRGRLLSLMRYIKVWDRSRLGYRFVKRSFDILFSAAVITVMLIPSLILCIIIRLESPGWPLYGQKRVGKIGLNGKPMYFTMWKFRSMVKDAEAQLDTLLDKNEIKGAMFKMKDDPRVTRVGKFIRRHSIDEFPQFLNVFLGNMSLVGPRPPLPREVVEYDKWAMQRLAVQPGLTGPWQVSTRSNVDFDDMVRLDLGYIVKRSIKTDLILICQTVIVLFTGSGAY